MKKNDITVMMQSDLGNPIFYICGPMDKNTLECLLNRIPQRPRSNQRCFWKKELTDLGTAQTKLAWSDLRTLRAHFIPPINIFSNCGISLRKMNESHVKINRNFVSIFSVLLLLLLMRSSARSRGFTILGEFFAYVTVLGFF